VSKHKIIGSGTAIEKGAAELPIIFLFSNRKQKYVKSKMKANSVDKITSSTTTLNLYPQFASIPDPCVHLTSDIFLRLGLCFGMIVPWNSAEMRGKYLTNFFFKQEKTLLHFFQEGNVHSYMP